MRVEGPMMLVLAALVIALWGGPLVELVALPWAYLNMRKDPEHTSVYRVAAMAVAVLYLLCFGYWLST